MRIIPLIEAGKAWTLKTCFILMGLFIAVSGCSDSDPSSPPPPPPPPPTPKLAIQWNLLAQDQNTNTSAGLVDCSGAGVATVDIVVYDDDKTVLASDGPHSCSDVKIEMTNDIAGKNRHFVILGRDAAGEIIYHGMKTLRITPEADISLDPIDMYAFEPDRVYEEAVSDMQIDISWTVTDKRAGIDGYLVYDLTHESSLTVPLESFSHQGLTASTKYCYQVSAYDRFDNRSKKSEPYCQTTTNRITDTAQSDRPDVEGDDGDYTINLPSYKKLDAAGQELPVTAAEWAMVKDNVTGLIWEIKTDTGNEDDIHDKHQGRHYWHTANGEFIQTLNREAFGGYSDWRMPSKIELFSLFYPESTEPTINTDYFPNNDVTYTMNGDQGEDAGFQKFFWTSEEYDNGSYGFGVSFSSGEVFPWTKDRYAARAVRGKPKVMHLVDNQDGTVTDKSTGLMWMRMDQLQGTPFFDENENKLIGLSWEAALAACSGLSFAGYDDWRMPNIKELFSITVGDKHDPSIDRLFFDDMPDSMSPYLFWSSTTSADTSQTGIHVERVFEEWAYIVSFAEGSTTTRQKEPPANAETIYVRPVRGGSGKPY